MVEDEDVEAEGVEVDDVEVDDLEDEVVEDKVAEDEDVESEDVEPVAVEVGLVDVDEPEDGREARLYISNLFPAPQYSYWFPLQMKPQSDNAAGIDPALIELPQ